LRYCGLGETDEAIAILDKIKSPSAINYNNVLGMYIVQKKLDKIPEILNRMSSSGVPPLESTYAYLLKGFQVSSIYFLVSHRTGTNSNFRERNGGYVHGSQK
jgi:pentatricopeptide repeat protein